MHRSPTVPPPRLPPPSAARKRSPAAATAPAARKAPVAPHADDGLVRLKVRSEALLVDPDGVLFDLSVELTRRRLHLEQQAIGRTVTDARRAAGKSREGTVVRFVDAGVVIRLASGGEETLAWSEGLASQLLTTRK